jgi:cell wall-associated NlpC family hydrolase
MNLVLGLLVLGGSAAAVWAGITDPEGGVWAGLRNVVQAAPNVKHTSAVSAAFVSDLATLAGTPGPASGQGGHSAGATATAYTPPAADPSTPPPAGANHYSAITGTWGSDAPAAGSGVRSSIIATARGWLGTPYRWGGTTRAGVDCSGFVQNVYAAHGIKLPRVSAAQAGAGRHVSAAKAQPADLVFFGVPAHHVGIVLGGGNMIHAPKPGGRVRVERIAGAVPGSPVLYRNVVG